MGITHCGHAALPTLADAARWKMDKDTDLAWLDQVHTVMGVLRAVGVLPVTRCSVNGHLHSLFSAMIVETHVGLVILCTCIPVSSAHWPNRALAPTCWAGLTKWFRRAFCTVHNKAKPMGQLGFQVGC